MEFVGIELKLIGAEGVEHDLREIDRLLNSLGGKKAVKSGLADLKRDALKTEAEIKAVSKELERLYGIKEKFGDSASVFVDRDIEKYSAQLQELITHFNEVKQAEKEVSLEARNMGKTFRETARSITSSLSSLGGRITTLGKTLGRIANPLSNLMRGTLFAAGYKALNMFTEGLGGAFERADIMSTYEKQLAELGLDAAQTFSVAGKEAKTAKDNLDDAVQGLPTALDEIMAAQKTYAGATGEMISSTKTAIAANNTFLASAMGSREQRFVQKYLVALSSGADLAESQWTSFFRIAPLAMRAVAKELGYTDKEFKQFKSDVKDGTIAGEEFLKAFQKVGTEGSVMRAARVTAMTWSGLASNITIAFKRLGEKALRTINDVFEEQTGRTLLQHLLGFDAEGNDVGGGIKHWINDISQSIQDWIKANPDKILDFFETLKSIDVKGLLQGIAQGFGDLIKIAGKVADFVSDKDLSKVGRFYTWLMPISKILVGVGGLIRGLSPILGIAGAGIIKLLGGKGKGLFGLLGRIFGKKEDIEAVGDAAASVPSVGQTLKRAFSALEGVIVAAGATAIVAGTAAFDTWAIKEAIRNIKDIGEDLKTFEGIDGIAAASIIAGLGFFTEVFNAIGDMLGPEGLLNVGIAGLASIFVAGAIDTDLALIKDGLQNILDSVHLLDDIAYSIDNMSNLGNTLKKKKQNLVDAVAAVLDIAEVFGGKNGSIKNQGEVTQGIPSINQGEVDNFKNILKVFDEIPKIIESLNKVASVGIATNARSKATQIMRAVKDVMTELSGLTWMTSTTSKLATNAANLSEAMKSLRTLARRINRFAVGHINQKGLEAMVEQIKTALETLKDLQGDLELDIAVKLSPTFEQSVKDVEKQINDARNRIARQSNTAINVNIPVKVKFIVSTNLGEALGKINENAASLVNSIAGQPISGNKSLPNSATPAKGGMIYRARGGNVPLFRRRGTDTVPAMLTPGEYVHNRRAVSMFGIDFMRKVNSLDMKGAMNELMYRAGGMANINRGSVVNNYNNQRVVINNNNAGAGFTFKSASRFVGAF